MTAQTKQLKELIKKISDAVCLNDVKKTTAKIKTDLEDLIKRRHLDLPDELKCPQENCYARRLVHQDPALGFVVVAMTWGPGQGTPIHDHAGIWCVEGVIQGELIVTSYNIEEKKGDLYKFAKTDEIKAGVGGAGALIPPYEHHLLRNALASESSVTLHVYGGEMNQCSAFVDLNDGWHRRETKNLIYD